MEDEKKETDGQEGSTSKGNCCGCRCCGCKKLLLGGLLGLVLAVAGFGLYHVGKCVGAGKTCCAVSQPQK